MGIEDRESTKCNRHFFRVGHNFEIHEVDDEWTLVVEFYSFSWNGRKWIMHDEGSFYWCEVDEVFKAHEEV